MFKKFMASLGKGGASVNLVLPTTHYQAGDDIEGEIIVRGGEVAQNINGIAVQFFMETPEYTTQIDSKMASSSFVIQAKEERTLPFTYTLPFDIPLSSSSVRFFFTTNLDIQGGVDNEDRDYIVLSPFMEVVHLFQAFEQLGFEQKHDSGKIDERGQEFAFEPFGAYRGRINEVEFYLTYHDDGIRLLAEIDIPGFFGEKELKETVFIPFDTLQDVNELAVYVNNWLSQRLQNTSDHPNYEQSDYRHHEHHHDNEHHHSSGIGEMIGGIAAGVVGGMIVNEVLDNVFDNDEEESDE